MPTHIVTDKEELEKWRLAGSIAAQALSYGASLLRPGASLLEVSDKIEEKILGLGGRMAFPVQISCDQIAAHYCAEPDDPALFREQVACLDIGVHVDGCIGDTAMTVDLSGKHQQLLDASRDALSAAIAVIRPGVSLGAIGRAVQDAITAKGFAPVVNLSGHGLAPYKVHTKPSIPNFDSGDKATLQKGQVIAIEPFATTGQGRIQESSHASIFSLVAKKPSRNPFVRAIMPEVEKFQGLPFTTRWLTRKFPLLKVNAALREMLRTGMLEQHAPLVEVKHGLVSQAEHSIIVDDEPEILTRGILTK